MRVSMRECSMHAVMISAVVFLTEIGVLQISRSILVKWLTTPLTHLLRWAEMIIEKVKVLRYLRDIIKGKTLLFEKDSVGRRQLHGALVLVFIQLTLNFVFSISDAVQPGKRARQVQWWYTNKRIAFLRFLWTCYKWL
eukprot:Filipodium_phascolosomae@DN6294_c0_g1_i1.p2